MTSVDPKKGRMHSSKISKGVSFVVRIITGVEEVNRQTLWRVILQRELVSNKRVG